MGQVCDRAQKSSRAMTSRRYLLKHPEFLFEPHEKFWKAPGKHPTWQVWGRSFRDFLKEWLSLEGRPRTCPHSPERMALTQGQLQIYPSRLSCAPESPISAVSPLDFLIRPKHKSKYLGVIPPSSFTCKFYVLRLQSWPGSASLLASLLLFLPPCSPLGREQTEGLGKSLSWVIPLLKLSQDFHSPG